MDNLIMNKNNISVSICCIAYNQENYIKDALDGFLMQKTDFPYEIIINDDASQDRTAEIIREYQTKFPDIIKPIYQEENQFSQGVKPFSGIVFPDANGKYIALCEGDDYWTDPQKLQKQVDFLERHPEFTICTHHAKVLKMETGEFTGKTPRFTNPTVLTLKDLMRGGNGGPTCSIMFRNGVFNHYPETFNEIRGGDVPLQVLCTSKGKLMCLMDDMGVFRTHNRSSYYYLSKDAHAQGIPTRELLYRNMLYQNKVLQRYFHYRYWYLIPRQNFYIHWHQSRYYLNSHYLKAVYYFLLSIPGLFSPRDWLTRKSILNQIKAIILKPWEGLYHHILKKFKNDKLKMNEKQ